jgi:hypothetical protein
VAVFGVVTLLVVLAARRVRWALPVLIVVAAVDLGVYGIGFVYHEPPLSIPRLLVTIKPAPTRPADRYAAAPEDGPFAKNLLVVKGYRLATGYVGFFPAAHHPLNGPDAIRLGGALWTFTPDGQRRQDGGGVARVRLLDASGQPAIGLAQMILDRPGHLSASVRVESPQILAFTERFHHGWQATADGRPIETMRIEGDFLGCRVEPGTRVVELRFAPRSFRNGVLVSIAGAVLLAGALIIWPR